MVGIKTKLNHQTKACGEMGRDRTGTMSRVTLKDMLGGRGLAPTGSNGDPIGKSCRDRVRVYDPEVKFISLPIRLQVRNPGLGKAD